MIVVLYLYEIMNQAYDTLNFISLIV